MLEKICFQIGFIVFNNISFIKNDAEEESRNDIS